MKSSLFAAVAVAALTLAVPAFAADVEVSGAFMRAAPLAGGNGIAFLTITNHGDADKLVAAESTISKAVELHTHVKDGEIYRMRKVDSIAVPAHGSAQLKPGGDHVMFIGVTQPVKEGTKVALTLVFEKAGKVAVEVPVQGAGAMGAAAMPDHGNMADHGAGMDHGAMHDMHHGK